MYCAKCGQRLTGIEKFCPKCGSTVNEELNDSIENGRIDKDEFTVEESGKSKKYRKRKRQWNIAGKVLLVIVCLIAVITIIYQFALKNEEEEEIQYLALVENEEGKYGYINEKGQEIIPCEYDWGTTAWAGDVAGVGVKDENDPSGYTKRGCINKNGEIVIPLDYDGLCLSNGRIWAGKERENRNEGEPADDWGCLDSDGKTLLDFEYQFEPRFESSSPLFDFENKNGWFVISQTTGEKDEEGNLIYYYGVMDNKGNVIIPIAEQYIEREEIGNSDLIAAGRDINGEFKYGYLNNKNEVAIPFEYDNALNFTDGLARVEKDGKYGYINEKGNIVIDCKYVEAQAFSNGLALVRRGDDQYIEYINKEGVTVISPEITKKWDRVYPFTANNRAMVYKESTGYGLINIKGEEVLPCAYDKLFFLTPYYTRLPYIMYGAASGDGEEAQYMIVNNQGELMEGKYNDLGYMGENGWCAVAENIGEESNGSLRQRWKYIDLKGDTVLELSEKYTWAGPFFPVL